MHRSMLAGAIVLFAGSALWGQATPAAPALQWGPTPPNFPAGAMMAVVSGDPSKPGPFVLQLKMPDGYTFPPHFHPTAEEVKVISGTFMFAMGDVFKAADLKTMTAGQSGSIPATMHHYAQAKGATVVQVSSTGPFVLTYVNPADDPTKKATGTGRALGRIPGTGYREPVWHDNAWRNDITQGRSAMRCHAISILDSRFPAVGRSTIPGGPMKRTIAIAVPVFLSVQTMLFAQQPMAPVPSGPGMVITGTMHTSAMLYGGWLKSAFDSIPASKFGFRPTPQQQSIGYIAQHLETANYLLCERFGGMTRPMTAKDSLADTIKALWPKDTLVARLKASLEFCHRAFAVVNNANLADSIAAGPPGSGRKSVRVRAVLIFVLDLVDHYSQLANYMRLNGMVPPSSFPALK